MAGEEIEVRYLKHGEPIPEGWKIHSAWPLSCHHGKYVSHILVRDDYECDVNPVPAKD